MTSDHFFFNNKKLKRNIAKVKAHGSIPSNDPIFHFESYHDMSLIRTYCLSNPVQRTKESGPKEYHKPIEGMVYNFTEKKSEAIKMHKIALEMGLNISTLVDMDYDVNGESFIGDRELNSPIPRIHSTYPSCTLLTYVLSGEKNYNQDKFFMFLRGFNELKTSNNESLIAIQNKVIGKTWKRLEAGYYMRFNKKKKQKSPRPEIIFKQKQLTHPINDHSLIEVVVESCDKIDKTKSESKLKEYFLRQHASVSLLLSPVLSDFERI